MFGYYKTKNEKESMGLLREHEEVILWLWACIPPSLI